MKYALLLLLAVPGWSMEKLQGWCQQGGQQVQTGANLSTTRVQRSYPSCTVSIYNSGTAVLATIYSDNMSTPKANPFSASATALWFFYAANARYDVTISGGGLASPITYSDFLLDDSSTGITTLNGLTATTQTFATGTSGTDFAIVSATSTHTFNLPTASGTNTGKLSAADWSTFNGKESVLTFNSPLSRSTNTISLGTVGITNGGTGQTTQTAAFDALSPTTTKGDLIVSNGSDNVRFPAGTNGYCVTYDSAQTTGLLAAPCFGAVPLTVPSGGTGATSLTGIVTGNGTSAMTATAAASRLQTLRRNPNGTGTTYEFATPPYIVSSDYDFTAQAPSGTLTGGVGATATLAPCPLGVNGADTDHYLYIATVGTPEAVLITGGTCTTGAASGTVTFTPANNHSAGWTIESATDGVQEAISVLAQGINQVWVPAGTTTLNSNVSFMGKTNVVIVLSNGLTIAGSGTLPATSTQTYIMDMRTAVNQNRYQLPVFSQTASVTVGNTTTETTLIGAGTGSVTLPANFFIQGKSIRLQMRGVVSSTGGPNTRIRVKLGATTILDSGAVASAAGTNDGFVIDVLITCRTTGATGTVFAQGSYQELIVGANILDLAATATSTVDTTGTLALDITQEWGTMAAGNTLTATNFVVENTI